VRNGASALSADGWKPLNPGRMPGFWRQNTVIFLVDPADVAFRKVLLASILLKAGQRDSPPLPSSVNEKDARRRQAVMKELRRILVAVLMGTTISVGAFAQKGNDNRPPKETPRVVDKEKKEKPPPSNNNQNSNRRDKP
jgi:hypothetical protein